MIFKQHKTWIENLCKGVNWIIYTFVAEAEIDDEGIERDSEEIDDEKFFNTKELDHVLEVSLQLFLFLFLLLFDRWWIFSSTSNRLIERFSSMESREVLYSLAFVTLWKLKFLLTSAQRSQQSEHNKDSKHKNKSNKLSKKCFSLKWSNVFDTKA